MKENLKTTKYKNGDTIPSGLNNTQWQNTTAGAWAYYSDSSQYNNIYGKLYNWYAVADARGLCPTGWHVPTDIEWNQLVKYLDPQADTSCLTCSQSPIAGGFMKAVGDLQSGTGLWQSPNTGASDSSGFSGLPGGARDDSGVYSNSWGYNGIWWSSSAFDFNYAWAWGLTTFGSYVNRGNSSHESGFSVRCVKDQGGLVTSDKLNVTSYMRRHQQDKPGFIEGFTLSPAEGSQGRPKTKINFKNRAASLRFKLKI